ncbi:MAG: aa3-type cytochrome c oxidase subunit IV [Rhizomicrobium sp.]
MAAHDHDGEQTGTMDISDHVRTWKLFTGLVKWSMVCIALLMLGLLIFRTHG